LENVMTKRALVTGANRGIGFEISRQLGKAGHAVLLGARDLASGEEAAAKLRNEGFDVTAVEIDVSKVASVKKCAASLKKQGVDVDVLVNNAGVIAEGDLLTGPDPMKGALGVNLMGPLQTARAFAPGMAKRGWGRIVNVSSTWGSFESGLEGPAAYAISKAALNALTVRLSRELGEGILINAMCPGWVRTRMGGDEASRSVQEGADTALFLATLPDGSPTGGFFRDRLPIAW
jgi:NAD(P)-dependent dehydrogenase (short-subunit alcohol dehydrogenase family)